MTASSVELVVLSIMGQVCVFEVLGYAGIDVRGRRISLWQPTFRLLPANFDFFFSKKKVNGVHRGRCHQTESLHVRGGRWSLKNGCALKEAPCLQKQNVGEKGDQVWRRCTKPARRGETAREKTVELLKFRKVSGAGSGLVRRSSRVTCRWDGAGGRVRALHVV